MKINIREDSVDIEGYVNVVERLSKPLTSRMGKFVERIRKGAFSNALKRSDNVHILLNHDWSRDLGSINQGNLELREDNVGLYAKATISDPEVITDARNGDLVGWSFGFRDVDVERSEENGLPLRQVKDMILREVSILNRKKSPAYEGNLIMVRDDDEGMYAAEDYCDEVTVTETRAEDVAKPAQQDPDPEEHKETVDYSDFRKSIAEMKGEAR